MNDLTFDIEPLFKKGDKVEVMEGPFKGATAIFSSEDGLERSILLLNILSQEKNISFANKEISKL